MNLTPNPPTPDPDAPLASVHTQNFPALLQQLRISLLVSTYQTGKLILIRADGEQLNTHFRALPKPMGIAATAGKIAVGSGLQILELHNIPAATAKLEPADRHDACYLLRTAHVTGDIDIHEMAWGKEDLWFVNTRFSCLCTLDSRYSFVPRWRPPFISALSPEDRCHLNGLSLVAGLPRYVTALGLSDTQGGWRATKANGGILMDVATNAVIAANLSMPHSPRWHDQHLWILESGQGSLAQVDGATGQLQTVTQLPGFTRGLDFYGSLAFVGLSQVRETAVFSGIPLTERLQERICGVWVIDLRSGQTVAYLKFEAAVQEIFAVQVLPGARFPEIAEGDHLLANTYVVPDVNLADVPQALRTGL
ncbi:TIGR03032 family protein [Synechococcales cyanobacterium C]|uniref:TIGR03032 family protein n=1 Tax=Petrachloros mirabilis ULC683 TaxID=2781853 RepID=A0A8K1ZXI3_9CYAN|nr:TIGR03032 family protein [Petrachloros mirabilis]NCJ05893.1 TIGR03032 family protein [Petrachloros mirabilis ULC683]